MEELERALQAAERKAGELQAWADASDAEAEQLRARVAELEARPAAAAPDKRLAELQAWADASDAEAEQLRARIAELEARPAGGGDDAGLAALQAEAAALRKRVTELELHPPPDKRVAELQAWVDASEKEADELRARAEAAEKEAAHAKQQVSLLTGSATEAPQLVAENRSLVARLSELEAVNHSLRQLNGELNAQVAAGARRDRERLEAQLAEARAAGAQARVAELEHALEEATEAVATLEVQKEAAVEQVKRYVEGDTQQHEQKLRALEDGHRRQLVALERQVATLEAQLAEKMDEVSVLHVRLKAHEGEEHKLVAEVATQRQRACTAEESLGQLQREVEELRTTNTQLQSRTTDLEHKLDEAKRWLAQGELENTELEKQLEAARTAHAAALIARPDAAEPSAPAAALTPARPPPPPADAANEDDLEGFSAQRLHRLEALLAAEKLKTAALERFAATAETSLRRLGEELESAQARLHAMAQRLGLAEGETGETLERLEAARLELRALFGELGRSRQPAPVDDGEELSPDDVLEAPMNELEQLAQQQAGAAKEATEALAGEQRAREQLMSDLTWLKAELEKLANVREDLKARLAAMVQRELKRKQVVSALLQKLRGTEVAAAARAGSLRRLQAAMEQAQKTAVRVQTVYFQKQIGSLQRQLENALGHRSPAARRR